MERALHPRGSAGVPRLSQHPAGRGAFRIAGHCGSLCTWPQRQMGFAGGVLRRALGVRGRPVRKWEIASAYYDDDVRRGADEGMLAEDVTHLGRAPVPLALVPESQIRGDGDRSTIGVPDQNDFRLAGFALHHLQKASHRLRLFCNGVSIFSRPGGQAESDEIRAYTDGNGAGASTGCRPKCPGWRRNRAAPLRQGPGFPPTGNSRRCRAQHRSGAPADGKPGRPLAQPARAARAPRARKRKTRTCSVPHFSFANRPRRPRQPLRRHLPGAHDESLGRRPDKVEGVTGHQRQYVLA